MFWLLCVENECIVLNSVQFCSEMSSLWLFGTHTELILGPLCAKMEPRKPQNASMCVKFRTAQGWARIKQAIVDTLWQQTEGLEQAGWKCRYSTTKWSETSCIMQKSFGPEMSIFWNDKHEQTGPNTTGMSQKREKERESRKGEWSETRKLFTWFVWFKHIFSCTNWS